MKAIQALQKWLCGAAVWFTATSLSMLLVGIIFLPSMDYISSLSYLLFFPFALCMSAAGMLRGSKRLSLALRNLLHYAITLAAAVLFLFLPSGVSLTLPFAFFLLLLFSMIYWIILGVLHMLTRRSKEQNKNETRHT